MHNLSRLLRLSLLITDEFQNEFKGAEHFALLQNAYSQSRYSSTFDPDDVSVRALSETVGHFYAMAEEIQQQFIESKKSR